MQAVLPIDQHSHLHQQLNFTCSTFSTQDPSLVHSGCQFHLAVANSLKLREQQSPLYRRNNGTRPNAVFLRQGEETWRQHQDAPGLLPNRGRLVKQPTPQKKQTNNKINTLTQTNKKQSVNRSRKTALSLSLPFKRRKWTRGKKRKMKNSIF